MKSNQRHLGPALLAGIALTGGLGFFVAGGRPAAPLAAPRALAAASDRPQPRGSRSRFFLPAAQAPTAASYVTLLNDETTSTTIVELDHPTPGTELSDADRHEHPPRPEVGKPQRPEPSSPDNIDTGRPFHEWRHLTDDWAGLRPQLDDAGVVLEADITIDWSVNLHGGRGTNGAAYRHLLNISLTLDTGRLGLWDGGTFFCNFQNQNGANGTDKLGDIQGYSNIDGDGRTQIAELWYEQSAFDGALRLKLGKIDANSEFAFVEHGGEFLNSSFGFSPTILGLTTFPDPSTGLVVFIQPSESFYACFGLFDGAAQEGVATGKRGPSTLLGSPADLFLIGELGARWTLGELPGRAALGLWHHTGTFERFRGGADHGSGGLYIVLDQLMTRENPGDKDDGQGLGFFLQYGCADKDVSEIQHHVGAGVAWTGPLPARDNDVAGLGFSRAFLSGQAGFDRSYECTVEAFYKAQLTPFASVKADVQYIAHPGGTLRDAVVGTLRFEFAF